MMMMSLFMKKSILREKENETNPNQKKMKVTSSTAKENVHVILHEQDGKVIAKGH